jgi:hypothetical protein
MKGTSLIAMLLFFWVILAYILVGLMGVSIPYIVGTYHPLSFLANDSLGKAAIFTVKYILFILAALLTFIVGSVLPNIKIILTLFVFLEVGALLLSYGVV